MPIPKRYQLLPSDVLAHLEKLPAVRAVAETGSIHAGSRALHISQPSLSVKIKTLEQALGAALFHRTPKGVRATREGALVADLARRIERSAADLCVQIKAPPGELAGTLRVGIYDSIARYLWPRFYRAFVERYPAVELPVSTARSSELTERLLRGTIDVALSVEPVRDRRLAVVDLFTDRFSLYGHWRFVGAQGLKVRGRVAKGRPEVVAPLPLYVFHSAIGEQGRRLEEVLSREGVHGSGAREVASFEVALEFCRERMGLAVLPNQVARTLYERGALVKVAVDGLDTVDFGPHRICASMLRDGAQDPVMVAVVRQLAQACV